MCSTSTWHLELLTEFAPRLLPATTNIRPLTGSPDGNVQTLYRQLRWYHPLPWVLRHRFRAGPSCRAKQLPAEEGRPRRAAPTGVHCSARPFTTNAIGVGAPDCLLSAAENTMLFVSLFSAFGDVAALSRETRLSTAG